MDDNHIAMNILRVQEKIHTLAANNNRNINDITLIGVSKYFPAQAAQEAVRAGLNDLGENRVSELIEKREILSTYNLHPNWHLIGTLQRKKVRQIVGKTHLIHSVDSIELLEEISKCSFGINIISPILLQLNISEEETKHGFDPGEINEIIDRIQSFAGINLKGIMTMAPLTQDEKIISEVFSKAQEIFYKMKQQTVTDSFNILSMGMSNDYPLAIKYGATHLRIGTAIFGTRNNIIS